MKYVVIFALVVAIAQIDTVVKLLRRAGTELDRQKNRMTSSPSTSDIASERSVITITDDATLQVSPYNRIIALLESFKLNPEPELRLRIMEDIKLVPKLLSTSLDPGFESAIYSWRDLLLNDHAETIHFLIDLEKLSQGENLAMIRKFYSSLLDQNVESFIRSYSRTKDLSCRAASHFAEPLPEEERLNELREREEKLTEFVQHEGLEEKLKNFANICLSSVKASLAPAPTEATAPVPVPTISPEAP